MSSQCKLETQIARLGLCRFHNYNYKSQIELPTALSFRPSVDKELIEYYDYDKEDFDSNKVKIYKPPVIERHFMSQLAMDCKIHEISGIDKIIKDFIGMTGNESEEVINDRVNIGDIVAWQNRVAFIINIDAKHKVVELRMNTKDPFGINPCGSGCMGESEIYIGWCKLQDVQFTSDMPGIYVGKDEDKINCYMFYPNFDYSCKTRRSFWGSYQKE